MPETAVASVEARTMRATPDTAGATLRSPEPQTDLRGHGRRAGGLTVPSTPPGTAGRTCRSSPATCEPGSSPGARGRARRAARRDGARARARFRAHLRSRV